MVRTDSDVTCGEFVLIHQGAGTRDPGCVLQGKRHARVVNNTQSSILLCVG